MKRLTLFSLAVGLFTSTAAIQPVGADGVKNGPRRLISESSSCDYPSTTVLTTIYRTEYKIVGSDGASAKPTIHDHEEVITARLRPYMSNYDDSCTDYRRVCDEEKDYGTSCKKQDENCNIWADLSHDGHDTEYVNGVIWLNWYNWVEVNCRDEIIY